MKRTFSFIAAAALMLSAAPMNAGADEADDQTRTAVIDGIEWQYTDFSADGTEVAIIGAEGAEGDIVIPEAVGGFTVGKIADKAFFCNTGITSVTFGKTVPDIGEYAFSGCLSLKKVAMEGSAGSIGKGAFMSCTELTEVSFGEGIEAIPEDCFFSCNSLKDIDIPYSVHSIGERAFFGCTSLKALYIPESVTQIGADAAGRKYDIRETAQENISGFVLWGRTGSSAQTYAEGCDIEFRIYSGEIAGDADLNGLLTAADATLVLREYADYETGEAAFISIQKKNADMNADGLIDARDASTILVAYADSQR